MMRGANIVSLVEASPVGENATALNAQHKPPARVLRAADEDRHSPGSDVPEEDTSRWDEFSRPRTPCEISNDPDTFVDSELTTCGVTGYVCGEIVDEPPSLEISFNYDIHASPEVASPDALAYVAEAILRETAQAMGVDDCRMFFNGGSRRLRGLQSSLSYQGFTGLMAEPKDLLRSDGCSSTIDADASLEDEICFPVVGGFTVYEKPSNINGVREELLMFVEKRMQEGAFEVNSLISRVVFLSGNVPLVPPTTIPSPPNTTPEPQNPPSRDPAADEFVKEEPPVVTEQDSGLATALVIAAAGLTLVVLIAYYGISRQRKSRNRQTAVAVIDDASEDMFDITDNSPHSKALAEKDSLALVPQKDMPHDTQMSKDRDSSNDLIVDLRSFDDSESYVSEGPGPNAGAGAGAGESVNNESVHGQPGEAAGTMDTDSDAESYMIGGHLSLIEENESHEPVEEVAVEQDDLDFDLVDLTSANSYDTKASARRLLQMT